jgi:hypothetical protein
MARSVPEWIGKDDDAKPTKAVRERIFIRGKGCCPPEDWGIFDLDGVKVAISIIIRRLQCTPP